MHPQGRKAGSVLDGAYDRVKKLIVDGAFKPGERVRALRLAKELGISRTPVKEALARLEQEGLVKREQGSGYIVRGLSVAEILNLYRVREVLEVEAARAALPNLTPQGRDTMHQILDRADELLDQKRYGDFLRANRKFHNMIAAFARNDVLEEILGNLDARFWSIGTVVVSRRPERAQEIRRENRAILDALISGNVRKTEEAVKAHVHGAAANVRAFIEQQMQNLFVVAA
jgi:DNA-binding GntR family transcriptional regulator